MLASNTLQVLNSPAAAPSLTPVRLPPNPLFLPLPSPPHRLGFSLDHTGRRRRPSTSSTSSYEVSGTYPDEELDFQDRFGKEGDQKLNAAQHEVLLKRGQQVTFVLKR
ncbi:hypothetical protein CDL15_Pgr017832 [Punica granatum]|uniref:Uncharacterized protein n=1 Tax=Punica granatum TaxID=22663 RepID=A0A218WHJ2_PUNGR|nr:hypothetical protein CDL15_Pgr017832 [Punica granatum]